MDVLQWCFFAFNPISFLSEWSDHQQGHWPVPRGGDVQRRQLRPAPGGPEMLRSEVDDTELDQASSALRREPETVRTAFLVAVGSRILDGQQETDWCCQRAVFHSTDSADLPSGCRAFQHRVFKKHLININSVSPSCALTGTIRRAAMFEKASIFKKNK